MSFTEIEHTLDSALRAAWRQPAELCRCAICAPLELQVQATADQGKDDSTAPTTNPATKP